MANSWREKHLGPIRILSHAPFAGLAGFAAFLGTAWLSGEPWQALFLCGISLIGAALWAQWVEGSPALLRPFGYFGTVVAAPLAAGMLSLFDGDGLRVLVALATVAPLVQLLGRLRCLVQGCCHGRPAPEGWGIRVRDPHSRVCKLANLVDVPIHPTPLYSILGNLCIGPLLLRAWWLGLPLTFIGGTYLLLSGFLRFVEEAYRGEPQTAHPGGLPIYQWLAIGMILSGGFLMAFPSATTQPPIAAPNALIWYVALAFGLLTAMAMGVDFPKSERRFARLSG